MAICLNTKATYKDFNMLVHDRYFVDKSAIIEAISTRINTKNRYVCITKPRRFGKTSVLNMLGAYYCKAYDSSALFDGLDISRTTTYTQHLNKYNVINLCLNNLSDKGNTYEDYINVTKNAIQRDLVKCYPELKNEEFDSVSEMLTATDDEFIFIIDEWDYIFSHELYPEHYNDFLEFLRNLLKDKPYVALAYMTGVLPIKKYSTGSALNMFDEYTMLNDHFFDHYFGFTENEVTALCQKQDKISIDAIRDWYNGYMTPTETRLYNPRSVVLALLNGYCQSYWTRSGKMDEVLFFLKYNIAEVRDDVIKMVNDMPVMLDIAEEYSAGQETIVSREEIYSAMIIYGLLSYHGRIIKIPNKELMLEFQKALKDNDFGYVAELVRNSDEVLNATWAKKGDVVASKTASPVL